MPRPTKAAGSVALVTGANRGIGLAFVRELAARGAKTIIGLEPPVATADGAAIAFSSRTIRFVPARAGPTGIVAVDVHATDRDHGVGQAGELCHTLIRFV